MVSGKLDQDELSFPSNQPHSPTQFRCVNVNTTLGEGGREAGNVHPQSGFVFLFQLSLPLRHPVPLWFFYLVVVSFTFY